jgi:hypothetical protein
MTPRIYTHYDNLKVARNAPPEVIRAAYKVLAQKSHPDRNLGNADAARIMAIINTSYEVLSNPVKRQEHDQWIAIQERMAAQSANVSSQPKPAQRPTPTPTPTSSPIQNVINFLSVVTCVGFLIWYLLSDKPKVTVSEPQADETAPASVQPESGVSNDYVELYEEPLLPIQPEYVKPSEAPNGQLWPASADYVEGYEQLHTDGLSTVTVDNSQNDSDVFVKLFSLDNTEAYPVRQFYIPAFGSFTLNTITAGSYDIRYRDLGNGGLSRSEAFNLKEVKTYVGVQFSNITMTLYKVQSGNMQTYGLSEAEF